MARLTITFDGADPSELPRPVARTNAEALDPGDIIEDRESRRYRVLEAATAIDYLAQCADCEVEVDEGKLLVDKDRLWFVEVME